jgi:hypothetical protein
VTSQLQGILGNGVPPCTQAVPWTHGSALTVWSGILRPPSHLMFSSEAALSPGMCVTCPCVSMEKLGLRTCSDSRAQNLACVLGAQCEVRVDLSGPRVSV